MKNAAKYLSTILFLLLAVIYISTAKSEVHVKYLASHDTTFEPNNNINKSYAEVASVNCNSISNIATANRRITRTNKIPSQLQFINNIEVSCTEHESFISDPRCCNDKIFKFRNQDYIYILCCIRI
ncbi:MAG: hypothetical protein RR277_04050 [Rikenellaceae bacterium]